MKIAFISVGLGLFWALLIRFLYNKFIGSDCQMFYFWWFAASVICGSFLLCFSGI